MSDEANSEVNLSAEQTPAGQLAPEAVITAGQMIKDARLASGLHIGTLSMALKVPVKKLEALESNDWTALPDMVFVRALATSVCRQIKIDSAPVLAALPHAVQATAQPVNEKIPLNQPFRTPNDAKFAWSKLPMSMPMMVGALALLLAAVILILLPSKVKEGATPKPDAALPVMPPAASVDMTSAPKELMQSPIASTTSATPTATTTPAMAASSAATSQNTAIANSGSILRIASKGVVWIEVKDSKGTVLVQRTMQPKEVANVSGQPPLAVVIGRINEIESVTVRGKVMNLESMSPDNVARFEVK